MPQPNEVQQPLFEAKDLPIVTEPPIDWWVRSHNFFAQMATESRRSSFGIFEKDFIKALLIRAQEAGLYDPNK